MYYIKWTPDYFDFDYCYGFKSLYDARHWIEHGHKIHDIAEHMYSVVIRNSNGIYKRRFFTIDDATAFITTNTEEHDDYILSPPSHTHNYSYNDDIGYIFFLLNPAIPNLVYIKFTLDEPNKFLEILSSGTGMPSEFIMAYQQKLDNFMDTKQRIKSIIADYKIANNVAFYNISLKDAFNVISLPVANKRTLNFKSHNTIDVISKKYNITEQTPFHTISEAKEYATAMHNTCWNVFIVNKEKEIQALSGSRSGGIGLISYLNVNKYDIISPYKITPKPINEKDDSNGYIYILTNRYMPGLLKIGKTVHPPKKRARDISRGINIPWEFELVYSKKVENCSLCERKIHDALDNYRYNPDREFFMITLDKALDVIESIT